MPLHYHYYISLRSDALRALIIFIMPDYYFRALPLMRDAIFADKMIAQRGVTIRCHYFTRCHCLLMMRIFDVIITYVDVILLLSLLMARCRCQRCHDAMRYAPLLMRC